MQLPFGTFTFVTINLRAPIVYIDISVYVHSLQIVLSIFAILHVKCIPTLYTQYKMYTPIIKQVYFSHVNVRIVIVNTM